MKKKEGTGLMIDVRKETARKRWTMFGSLLLMLLISALLAGGCFAFLLRMMFRADWNALHKGTVLFAETLGGDFIEKNYKGEGRQDDYDEICDSIAAEAKKLQIDRVCLLDPADLTCYYIYTNPRKDNRIYYRFYGILGGCLDDSQVKNEQRKASLSGPVYSTGINGSFIRDWVRSDSKNGASLVLCTDRYAGESIESCWQLCVVVFCLLTVFYHVLVLLVYFRLIRKPTVSIRELSDDMDQYYASGVFGERSAPDRIVQKIRQDIRHLVDKNNVFYEEQCEKGKAEAIEAYNLQLEHQADEFFLPENELKTENGASVLQAIHLWDDLLEDDVIDIFRLNDDRLAFMIAKLPRENHSMLLPVLLKVLFRCEMLRTEYPEKAGNRVSSGLRAYFGNDIRIPAFFGLANADGRLSYVNAGYNIPFLSVPGEPVRYLEGECGKVLGEDADCIGHSHKFAPGTVMVCLSEGNELFSEEEQNTLYGRERLKKLIEEWRAHPDGKDLNKKLEESLRAHAKEVNVTREKTALIAKVFPGE